MKGTAKARFRGPNPARTSLEFTDHERGWRLELEPNIEDWSVETLSVTRLEDGHPLTAESLRVIATALPGLLSYLGRRAPVVGGLEPQEDAIAASGEEGKRLVQVARVYRQSSEIGEYPVEAVAAEFVVSKATANRWIRAARDLGLLPPTGREKGKSHATDN